MTISMTAKRSTRVPASERRIQLLNIGRDIIVRHGVGALTMSRLADAAGITKPIVYRHFSNSEEVVIEILERYTRGSILAAADRVRGAATIFEFIDRLIESLFDYIKREGAITRSITNGFSSSERIDASFRGMQQRALRVYKHLIEQQGIPERKASVAAYALMEMINSTILEIAPNAGEEEIETLKQMARGVLQVLVPGQGIKPTVPGTLLQADRP